jgi:hypothetical protein
MKDDLHIRKKEFTERFNFKLRKFATTRDDAYFETFTYETPEGIWKWTEQERDDIIEKCAKIAELYEPDEKCTGVDYASQEIRKLKSGE